MAIDCLRSIRAHCDRPIRFHIHEDGSITDEDASRLWAIGDVRLVTRREADERMADELKNFPAARRLRDEMPLALKLLDTVLFHPGPDYAFADADVLFLRPFVSPFQLDCHAHHAVFMEDRENCYCFRSWNLLRERSINLPARVNTGLVVFRKSQYDLDALNWFLTRPACRSIPSMREQTAWAFLGNRVGCRKFNQKHARIMREGEPDGELIAGHFTARTRRLLPEYVSKSRSQAAADAGILETTDGGSCRASDLAIFEMKRALRKAWPFGQRKDVE